MAYQGYSFIYDNTPSQKYGLKICSFDTSGFRYAGGSSMEIIQDRSARSIKTHIFGAVPSEVLEFDLEVVCENELNDYQSHSVKSWLFGQITPKKLFIVNGEHNNVYFNCILNKPEDVQINGNNGWKFTVTCDAGGAWEMPKTKRYTPAEVNGIITINNTSGNNDYTYPTIAFKLGVAETGLSIVNQTDGNREFKFTGLSNSEVISVNGDTKSITSSTNLNRLNKFNKNFLRIKRGANTLVCNGTVEYIDVTTQNFIRLGG